MSDHPPGPAARGGAPDDAPVAPRPAPDPAPEWDALARLIAGEPARARGPEDVAADLDAIDAETADLAAEDLEAADAATTDAAARAWAAAHPTELARLRAADALGAAYVAPIEGTAAPVDVEAALARVRRQIAASEADAVAGAAPDAPAARPPLQVIAGGAPRPAAGARPRRADRARPAWATRPARWIAGGAALAAAAALALTVVRRGPDTGAPALRYATTTGQRTNVRLPDGTRVLLGPSSTLASVGAYGQGTRTLTLEGEAFFDVVHDDARPFVVRAGPAVVRDLGTAFVVRAGAATGRTTVAVTQGSVALAPADAELAQPPAGPGAGPRPAPRAGRPAAADTAGAVLLRAGDRGLVDRPAGAPASTAPRARRLAPTASAAAGAADDLAWTTGRLVFRDAPLTEVADALHRWYGLTLRVADPALAGRTLTASFQGESPDQVLRVVTLSLGARFDRRGDTVFVRSAR